MGVRPPFLTVGAVLAMAPVAGIPPNMGDTQLAMPWATSSILDLWLPPIIPSATTAQSKDSMAASMATVIAEGKRSFNWDQDPNTKWGWGKPWGIPPKRVPMVSTGQWP